MPKRTDSSTEDYGADNEEDRSGKRPSRAADWEHSKAAGQRDGRRGDGKAAQRDKTGRRHSRADSLPPHRNERDGLATWNE